MEEDNWDLQAVVRGFLRRRTTAEASASRDPFSSFPPSLLVNEERVKEEEGEDDLLFRFPDLLSTPTALQELEELCKPFFTKSPQQQHQDQQQKLPISPQRSPSSTSAASLLPAGGGGGVQPLLQQQPRQPQQRSLSQTPRSKRRKNQQKRVVCQVPADGLSSDMWAWRKYGQKPIKGSPYPRGYYRCSSSKGCLARKQVERSRTDPGMFVITYTAEHNHPLPTHRNSLAGSTRHKFPLSSSSSVQQVNASGVSPDATAAGEREQPHKDSSSPLSSPTAAAGLSPTTPLTASMEDELLLPRQSEGEEVEEEEEEDSLLVEDMEIMGDEDMLFMGSEELLDPTATTAATFPDGFAEQFSAAFPSHWVANSTATTAGGS